MKIDYDRQVTCHGSTISERFNADQVQTLRITLSPKGIISIHWALVGNANTSNLRIVEEVRSFQTEHHATISLEI